MRRYIMIILIGLFSVSLEAETWIVDTTGAEGDSLQAAIDSAWADPGVDTVLVENGTYHVAINLDTVVINGDRYIGFAGLRMRNSVVLMSKGGRDLCTLTAVSQDLTDIAWHVIYCDSVTAKGIKGFTITEGNAKCKYYPHNHGGGIFCYKSSPKIDSCRITNNSSSHYGGGVFINYSSPIISGNEISNDSAKYCGGGICIYYASSPTISGNEISNNSSGSTGGGIYIRDNNSSPTLTNNTIKNNSAKYGGGLHIYKNAASIITDNTIESNSANSGGGLYLNASSPTITNNTIKNNSADSVYGGGLCIYKNSSPALANNTIENNLADYGGGLSILTNSSPTLTNNTIGNNSSDIYGGGLFVYINSSPTLINNTIENNSADHGGGVCIFDTSSPTLTNNIIENNSANSRGGGLFISDNSSPAIISNTIVNNVASFGGAIYNRNNDSTVIIDSCFIVDNGSISSFKTGLVYSSAEETLRISNSHLYYNTYQPDIEIYNNTGITMPLENNFWWDTDSTTIQSLIEGPADIMPFDTTFIPGVPGEPTSVDSVRNYADTTYSVLIDWLGQPDTLHLRIYGQDRNTNLREAAVAILKTSVCPEGIAIALMETDTNSGIYEGEAYVLGSTGSDTIRLDDIYQRVRVNPSGDTITICANTDTSGRWLVIYKTIGIAEHRVEPNWLVEVAPNPFVGHTVIKYGLSKVEWVTIKVFDVTGRCLRTLVDNPHKPGCYHITWYREDDKGKKLPAGVYFFRVNAGEFKSIKKAIIMR